MPGYVRFCSKLLRERQSVLNNRDELNRITHWQHPNFYAYFPANVSHLRFDPLLRNCTDYSLPIEYLRKYLGGYTSRSGCKSRVISIPLLSRRQRASSSSQASLPRFNWLCSPASTELETVVMDWVAKLLGLDQSWWNESKTGGGIIMMVSSCPSNALCI